MMKKWIMQMVGVVLGLWLMLPMTSYAAAVTGSLTGPTTVRAGDSITLTFKIKGQDIKAFSATFSYDESQVTLSKVAKSVADPWSLTTNGNELMLADEQLSKPINKETKLFTAVFKVKSNLKVGTKISISLTNCVASTGSAQTVGKTTYSATIAAPKSTNNNLKALLAAGGTLSPAFSADTTNYSMTVPFSVSKLNVTATAANSEAKVAVSGTSLSVGTNTVTVTVTAESGDKKTYTIKVKREQDPNYQPSANAALKGIKIDGYVLSPVFDPEITAYLVWLPYETESVSVNGTPADSKAKVEVQGGEALEAGKDNPVKVICTAEDGTTTKEYVILAKRAAPHGSEDTPDGPPVNAPDDPEVDQPGDGANQPGDGQNQPGNDVDQPGDVAVPEIKIAWLWLAGAGGLLLGLMVGLLLGKRRRRKH